MKKLFALLLCVVMMLAMAACGGEAGNISAPKGEPTEKEIAAIGYYETAMNRLNEYVEKGGIAFRYAEFGIESAQEYVNGQKAVAEYYKLLTSLDAVDKWFGTEYTANTEINWDRQAVLNSFCVVEGVLVDGTYTEKSRDSEPTEKSLADVVKYDADGKALSFSNGIYHDDIWEVIYDPSSYLGLSGSDRDIWTIEYDEDGKIARLVRGYSTVSSGQGVTVNETRTFTYDASGNRIKENLKNARWDIDYTYTYDNAGRLSQISWNRTGDTEILLTIDYIYDDAGRLIRTIEKNPQRDSRGEVTILSETTCEYTYDNAGLLITKNEHIAHLEKGIYSTKDSQYPGWAIGWERTNTYSYNYDAAGQLQTKDVTYGDTYSYSGDSAGEVRPSSVETEKYEYIFGNYYIYTPAN